MPASAVLGRSGHKPGSTPPSRLAAPNKLRRHRLGAPGTSDEWSSLRRLALSRLAVDLRDASPRFAKKSAIASSRSAFDFSKGAV
jgi:hypothetical protein